MGSARGLKYLHNQNIVHGDLKGVSRHINFKVWSDPSCAKANILIDSTHSARLGDFGLTTIIDEPTAGITTGGRGPKGTTRWMAPELMYPERFAFTGDMLKQLPSKSTDIYALGMTTLEVFVPLKVLKTLVTFPVGANRKTAFQQPCKRDFCNICGYGGWKTRPPPMGVFR